MRGRNTYNDMSFNVSIWRGAGEVELIIAMVLCNR